MTWLIAHLNMVISPLFTNVYNHLFSGLPICHVKMGKRAIMTVNMGNLLHIKYFNNVVSALLTTRYGFSLLIILILSFGTPFAICYV